jgi:hypothetical protein
MGRRSHSTHAGLRPPRALAQPYEASSLQQHVVAARGAKRSRGKGRAGRPGCDTPRRLRS